MESVTLTDIAAWIGAAAGSLALLWEIYKWARSGPKLRVSVNPHMVMVSGRGSSGGSLVMISVVNQGDRKTTVQAVGFNYFDSTWKSMVLRLRWLSKIGVHPTERYVLANSQHFTLPATLDGGEEWRGVVEWSDVFARAQSAGSLYAEVAHSMSDRAVFSKVLF